MVNKNFPVGYAVNSAALCLFCNFVAKVRIIHELCKLFAGKFLLNIFKTQKLFTYNFITSILVIPGGNVAGGQT